MAFQAVFLAAVGGGLAAIALGVFTCAATTGVAGAAGVLRPPVAGPLLIKARGIAVLFVPGIGAPAAFIVRRAAFVSIAHGAAPQAVTIAAVAGAARIVPIGHVRLLEA